MVKKAAGGERSREAWGIENCSGTYVRVWGIKSVSGEHEGKGEGKGHEEVGY